MQSLHTTAPADFDAGWEDAKIGRYMFRRVVGSGGMGVVIAAHDPELDREVAIKLVVTGDGNNPDDDRALREAQAMAKLAHPNVVQVYEMLRLGPRTAIVMQLVEGEDLAAWQKRDVRSWRAIVEAYLQAARGLAAAHRAGIVHRDFKPSNVLVDRDGLVRVTDFGLARRATDANDASLRLAGTPAYMAPEQHRGEDVDARTDQWSFACALHEALYGRRPYEAEDRDALAAEVLRGELPAEPSKTPVPRRLRAAIRRALATDPAERFATIDELADELAVAPRRLHYGIAAAFALAVVLAVSLVASGRGAAACEGLAAPMRATWTDPVRAQLRARLLAPDVGLPAAAVERALHGLDAYATTWTETRTRVCKDAQQGVRSTAGLDTRMRCLDHRLAEVAGVLDGLAGGGGATLRAASDAVGQLKSASACADAKEVDPIPVNLAFRPEVDAAESALARATAFVSLGQFENAIPLADRAASVGQHASSPSLMARALVVRSEGEDRLGKSAAALDSLHRAATAAAKARDNTAIVDALARAFFVDGDHLGHRADALRTQPFIELVLESAGQPDAERAEWLHFLAALLYDDPAHLDEAAADERESLAIRQRTLPPDHVYIYDSMETLANIEAAREHFDDAERLLQQVLVGRTASRGPSDGLVGAVYNNIGVLNIRRNDLVKALDALRRAVAIADGVGRPNMAAIYNVGITELELGRLTDAAKTFARALDLDEKNGGPDSRGAAESATFLGVVWLMQGDLARARPMLLRGIAAARRSGSPSLSSALSVGVHLALHDGDRAKAHTLLDEALKLSTATPSIRSVAAAEVLRADAGCRVARPKLRAALAEAVTADWHYIQAFAIEDLAQCEIELGDSQGARGQVEAQLARLTKDGADEAVLAQGRALLAKLH